VAVIDAVLVGGPLDGAIERVLAPCPDTLDYFESGDIVTYVCAGFQDRGFDEELAVYFLAAAESIAA